MHVLSFSYRFGKFHPPQAKYKRLTFKNIHSSVISDKEIMFYNFYFIDMYQGLIIFTLLVTVKKAMRKTVFLSMNVTVKQRKSKQTNKLYVTVIRAMTNSGVGQV